MFTDKDCMLSYLPLAHSFDRIIEELALCVGGHIGYWRVRVVVLRAAGLSGRLPPPRAAGCLALQGGRV